MKKHYSSNLLILLMTLAMIGCGGGSDSSEDSMSSAVNQQNQGGTASNPSQVSYSEQNVLSDPSNNYFSITLESDSTVFISAMLDYGLETLEKTRCASDANGAFIRINDTPVACDHRAIVNLEAGTHELHFEFPLSGTGYFSIDSVTDDTINIQSANGEGGKPSSPREFLVGGNNQISKDFLNNFYAFTGSAGDRVVIYTFLNEAIPQIMYTRCRSSDGKLERTNKSALGISVNNGTYNCDGSIDYQLPEDGTFIFNFFYMAPEDTSYPVDGYFTVDIQ